MELRHLRYFVTVAQELHFGRAANKLHIAQPALSIQIKALEKNLGGDLFKRTSRSVTLTEAGEKFLIEAKLALEHASRAELVAKSVFAGDTGRLTVGYSGSVTYSGLLGQFVQSFRQSKPYIELHLKELDPFTQLEQLASGDIDAGFLTTYSLTVPDTIHTTALSQWPPCVAMPANHPLSERHQLTMQALKHESFITYSSSHRDDGAAAIRQLANYEPNIISRESNIMSVLALVGSGMGISIVPDILSKTLHQPGLIFKPLHHVDACIEISLAHPKAIHRPSLNTFIDHIHALMESY
ncbi:LysR family transcriptional regulator [Vibrio nitrifigilis]|uniref:LysR family transcriptional regulator n=1 Tax=Vibrio nitrifigilis TaxID=2789781 RepID=A0ABS0GB08_9VIBR|nr:LysR substrate-binding domain-containing protein [Vibrio nitrifigilis]MBF8999576.1 LysR family transcriptional regulator [Vibrio nitrifigilis]